MKVALYARLSVSKDESVSIARQLEAGRDYAKARGFEVVAEFTDDGVSASKTKPEDRPGWRALLSSQERLDAVVVWKVDRLARRVLDFLNADRALQERGAGIVCVADPIDMTTAQGRAFATVLAVFAELEAESISARVKDARRALLRAGRRGGGRPPYGFRNAPNPSGPGVVLAQDPDTIGHVKGLVARAQAGDSVYTLARWMDDAEAPRRARDGRRGPHWSEAAVESILRNPALAGLTPYQPGRKPGSRPDDWAVLRDEDGLPVVDESVAILSLSERRRLLDALDARLRPGSRPRQGQRPHLLSGLLRCSTCGHNLHYSIAAGKYPSYRCAHRGCSAKASVGLPRADAYVVEQALAERGDYRHHEFNVYEPDNAALAQIEEALRDAGRRLTETDDEAEVERLLNRIGSLKSRRAGARSRTTTKQIVSPSRGQLTFEQEWAAAEGDVPARQRLIREMIECVTVAPSGRNRRVPVGDRLSIEWVPVADEA